MRGWGGGRDGHGGSRGLGIATLLRLGVELVREHLYTRRTSPPAPKPDPTLVLTVTVSVTVPVPVPVPVTVTVTQTIRTVRTLRVTHLNTRWTSPSIRPMVQVRGMVMFRIGVNSRARVSYGVGLLELVMVLDY